MASTQSGATGDDIQEIAALGNFGKNASHIAAQMERKFCKSPDIDLPTPYLVECPVKVVTSDGLATSLKRIGMYLPHEWFHWMSPYPLISGLDTLESFWGSHSPEDPQLLGNPVKETGIAFLFADFHVLCELPLIIATVLIHAAISGYQRKVFTSWSTWRFRGFLQE